MKNKEPKPEENKILTCKTEGCENPPTKSKDHGYCRSCIAKQTFAARQPKEDKKPELPVASDAANSEASIPKAERKPTYNALKCNHIIGLHLEFLSMTGRTIRLHDEIFHSSANRADLQVFDYCPIVGRS